MPIPRLPASQLLLSAFLFLTPLWGGFFESLRPSDDPTVGFKLAGLRILLLVTAAVRLVEARRPGALPWNPATGWLVPLYAAWSLVTVLTGVGWRVSFDTLHLMGSGWLAYLLVTDATRGRAGRAALFTAVVAGAAITSAWGLREYLGTVRESSDTSWRIFSTFQNPNLLASYLLMSLFPALSALLVARRPWGIAAVAGSILCGIGLLLTGSRGAVVYSLPVAFIAWLILSHLARPIGDIAALRSQRLRIAGIVAAGCLLGTAWMRPTAARVGSAASTGESNSTLFRLLTWRGTLDLISERPLFGWGPGSWETAYSHVARAGYTRAAHNGYLQIGAEAGLPGLLLWVGILAYGIGGRKSGDPLEAGRAAALVASALHNGVDYGWLLSAPSILTWTLLGARPLPEKKTMREGSDEPSAEGRVTRSARRKRIGGIGRDRSPGSYPVPAAFAGIAVFLTAAGFLPAFAHWQAVGGNAALSAGNGPEAVRRFSNAARIDPTESEWPRRLGEIYRATGDIDSARKSYLEAVRRDPLRASHRYRLAQAFLAGGRVSDAKRILSEALALDPNSTRVLLLLAEIDRAEGRPEDAIRRYRKITTIEESPVGRVTALSGMEDLDYSRARLALARDAEGKGRRADAALQTREGLRSVNAHLRGMETTWAKVKKAGGQSPEEVDAQLEEARRIRRELEAIASRNAP